MEKIAEHEVIQLGILYWARNATYQEDVKELLSSFPVTHFGKFQPVAEWFMDNGTEPTTEMFSDLKSKNALSSFNETIDPKWFTTCPYSDAKKLCRIALGNAGLKTDIVSVLKEYEETVERIESLRVGANVKKFSGLSVFTSLYEEVAEKHENGGMEELSGYATGFDTIDKVTDGLRKGTVTRLSAYANTGKSKFSYHLTNNLLKQGAKVLYFSLEVNAREVALNLSANWFDVGYYDLAKGREIPDFGSYPSESVWIVDNVRTMSGIETMVKKLNPDVVMIDFVQNVITEDRTEYERMTNVAVSIQNLAVSQNVAIFDLSQVSNEGKDFVKGGVIPSKGSGALAHSADIALVLTRDVKESFLSLHIAKNKFGRNNVSFYLKADYSKSTFEDKGEINDSKF